MLLNKVQKEKFKYLYPVLSIPDLMKYYGTNNRTIIAMAKQLNIYSTKIGKFKNIKP